MIHTIEKIELFYVTNLFINLFLLMTCAMTSVFCLKETGCIQIRESIFPHKIESTTVYQSPLLNL